jgi:polar amino acid transport system ATP-binding protein
MNESDVTDIDGTAPASTAATMVRMDKVTKVFGDFVCLDELDLEVRSGEKVVVIGPSGSGKTTILRVLMTLERPDSGVIEVGGEPLYHERRGGELVKAREKHVR